MKFDIKNLITFFVLVISLFFIPRSIIFAIIIFGILVLVHEFGHYIVAVKSGVFVEEFAIGMGPKIIGVKPKDTLYSLRILPLGGYCKMLGEDEECEDERAFNNAPVLARIATIFAGPFFNFLLTIVAAIIFISIIGYSPTVINGVKDGYPAQLAGLTDGDKIVKINGDRVYNSKDVNLLIQINKSESLTIEYLRNNKPETVKLNPVKDNGGYIIGITFDGPYRDNVFKILKYSMYEVRTTIKNVYLSFRMLFSGNVSKEEMAGPVGIIGMISSTYTHSEKAGALVVLLNFLSFVILLSFNLGVVNLLPFPALDGGRLAFLIIEAIRGKPINRNVEGTIHLVGFTLLMVLMVFLLFNDIVNLKMGVW